MEITLLTCSFGTPELVINLLRSVKKTSRKLPGVVVVNTSRPPLCPELDEKGIPHCSLPGGIHGEGVNFGLKQVKTRYVLLVDSDVIFLKDFREAFDRFRSAGFTLMGRVAGDCGEKRLHPRVVPWCCFMDLHRLREHGIEFFDHERTRESRREGRVYDIGSTLFEDVLSAGLSVGDVDLEGDYFRHYGGMSWHVQSYNPGDGDTDVDFGGTHPHVLLFTAGRETRARYERETRHLEDVDITVRCN